MNLFAISGDDASLRKLLRSRSKTTLKLLGANAKKRKKNKSTKRKKKKIQ
jgi:hypothetical protein